MGSPKVLSWVLTLYATPLSHTISSFNVTRHLYANDTQIYLALDSRNFDSCIAELTECLAGIQEWMDGVRPKLNPEKKEFTVIGDRPGSPLCKNFPPSFLEILSPPTNKVKNLGVTFDSGNTYASHITKVCRACYYHLKDFRGIRKFLSVETAALLANSMISSRINYRNSLLYGVNK